MSTQRIETFQVIGISVRTTNENGQAATDIPALWAKFMQDEVHANIPGKTDNTIYCIYTDYEKDHTRPYTTILGCAVSSLDVIPKGMVGKTIEAADYEKFVAKGDLMQGAVYNKWLEIWTAPISRTFTSDFEVYGEKSQNAEDAEVDILIAVA